LQDNSVPIMTGALKIRAAHRLSYWDAAIATVARALGFKELYFDEF
jgi:predicted nucleic acid-binding protein